MKNEYCFQQLKFFSTTPKNQQNLEKRKPGRPKKTETKLNHKKELEDAETKLEKQETKLKDAKQELEQVLQELKQNPNDEDLEIEKKSSTKRT